MTTEKVTAYITDGDKLLVFSHPHHPDAGIQVPTGTVEQSEPLDDAVLREAHEETGLDNLEIEFEFFWAQFPGEVPELAAGQGELLHKLGYYSPSGRF